MGRRSARVTRVFLRRRTKVHTPCRRCSSPALPPPHTVTTAQRHTVILPHPTPASKVNPRRSNDYNQFICCRGKMRAKLPRLRIPPAFSSAPARRGHVTVKTAASIIHICSLFFYISRKFWSGMNCPNCVSWLRRQTGAKTQDF